MEREGQEILKQLFPSNLNLLKASINIDIYINPFLRVEIKKGERGKFSKDHLYLLWTKKEQGLLNQNVLIGHFHIL